MVGNNGVLDFFTDYYDNSNIFDASNIEQKTSFQLTITNLKGQKEDFITNCNFAKKADKRLILFCKLSNNFPQRLSHFSVTERTYYYNGYTFLITANGNGFRVYQFYEKLPILYNDKQIINVKNSVNTYELKFKINDYDNQILFLCEDIENYLNLVPLNDCSKSGNYLSCKLSKSEIEGVYKNINICFYMFYGNYTKINLIEDITFQYDSTVQDIYVGITKLLVSTAYANDTIAYETNVTSISNMVSPSFKIKFNDLAYETNCVLRKDSDKPLLVICLFKDKGTFYLGTQSKKIVVGNNVKYNFIIQPVINNVKFVINENGAMAKYAHPNILNLNSYNQITIQIWGNYSVNFKNLRLIPDSNDLQCKNEDKIQKCIVSRDYFENKKSGYYYTYQLNNNNEYSIYYNLLPFKVILPDNNIYLRIKKEDNSQIINVGQNGVIYFTTHYDDIERNLFNINDIEDNTKFSSIIKDKNNNEYNVNCKLWKPKNEKIKIICNINGNLKYTQQYIILNEISLNYKEYNIFIIPRNYVLVNQYNYDISFLYSDKQIINIMPNINSYNLQFKIGSYYNDVLYIFGTNNNYGVLDKCDINGKILNCEISKLKVEEILTEKSEQFKIGSLNKNYGNIIYDIIFDITINYYNIQKVDIFVGLLELMGTINDINTPLAFKTNITQIPNLITQKDDECYFIKQKEKSLLYLCPREEEENLIVDEVQEEELILDNIHYKYNFRIQPYKIKETITIKNQGTSIYLTYPEELNFNLGDTLTIFYIMGNPTLSKNIRLNPESSDLNCDNLNNLKKCNVSIDHFADAEQDLYNTYHSNYLGDLIPYYESSVITVTYPYDRVIEIKIDEKNYFMTIGLKGMLYFYTTFNDTKSNIFDASDIEQKTAFTTTIKDSNSLSYNVNCRIWKPKKGKLIIFCKLNDKLKIGINRIILNGKKLKYNNYRIVISSNANFIDVEQLDETFPLLYSDEQIINIKENIETYYLKFNIGVYNNEVLLFGDGDIRTLFLEKCLIENQILTCPLQKEEIENILNYNGEIFYLNTYNDEHGFNNLELVSNIIFIYDIQKEKENIYIKVNKLLNNTIDLHNFISYETNVTSNSKIISTSFLFGFETEFDRNCFFKKNDDQPLLILCLSSKQGTFSLGEIKDPILFDDIHIRYNFIISPVINNEEFNVGGEGNYIIFAFPRVLDFTKTETITINFLKDREKSQTVVRLIPDLYDLECIEGERLNRCVISIDYFTNKKSGYYYAYHLNYLNKVTIYSELDPFKVILPTNNDVYIKIKEEDNNQPIIVGKEGVIYFVADYYDKRNIFNENDIEENSNFVPIFKMKII